MNSIQIKANDIQDLSFSMDSDRGYQMNQRTSISLYMGNNTLYDSIMNASVNGDVCLFEIDFMCGQLVFTGKVMSESFNVTVDGTAVLDLTIHPVYVAEEVFQE